MVKKMVKNLKTFPIIDLIEVRYEDGYRYMTQEEFDRLYTMKDLRNTVSSIGTFIFQKRSLLLTTLSFLSGFISLNQNVQATTNVNPFPNFNAEIKVLQESFDPEKSYQEFLQRTGNLKPPKTFKGFGKSHRLGSSLELENNFSSLLNQTKGVLTLGSFLRNIKSMTQNEGIRFQVPTLNSVENILQGGRYLLSLRGGSTFSFSPSFSFYFLFSILWIVINNSTPPNLNLNEYETGREVLEMPKKRTWVEYLKTYTDFRTPKPYLVLFLLVFIYLGYQNRSHIIQFFIDAIDAYEESLLEPSSPKVINPTAEMNEKFLKRIIKERPTTKLLLMLKKIEDAKDPSQKLNDRIDELMHLVELVSY